MADEVLYLLAVRTKDHRGGAEIHGLMEFLAEHTDLPEGEYVAIAAVRPYSELTANDHERLQKLGFTWDEANQLVTVAREAPTEGSTP